ncbi:MAG: hypothetical protein AAF739_06435 [Pseudomonadota bacterium]
MREADGRLSIGDRADGVEVTGSLTLTGLGSAYSGIDSTKGDQPVSIVLLQESPPETGVRGELPLLNVDRIIRYGTGPAAVFKGDLHGVTVDHWIRQAAPAPLGEFAAGMLPIVEALQTMHRGGSAHGYLNAHHIILLTTGEWRLLPPLKIADADWQHAFQGAQAPEALGGEEPGPAADVFSVGCLIYRAISGCVPSPAAERLDAQARHDNDPLTALGSSEASDGALRSVTDRALRLHPAVRPQSLADFREALAALAQDAPKPMEQTVKRSASVPPPLPQGSGTASQRGPWGEKERASPSGAVPPIRKRTSTIGAQPAATAKPKRSMGKATVIGFIVALAVAWVISTGGLGLIDDQPGNLTPPTPQPTQDRQIEQVRTPPANQPSNTLPNDPLDPPTARKGPSSTQRPVEDDAVDLDISDGVLESLCSSTITFQQARDDGPAALRRYIERCTPVDGEFVDEAFEALDN